MDSVIEGKSLYSVALCFTRQIEPGKMNIGMSCKTLWAINEHDAFGKVYDQAKAGDFQGHELFHKVVYKLSDELLNSNQMQQQ